MSDINKKVAITGLGFMSPAGMGVDTLHDILSGEKSADGKLPTYNPDKILGKRGLRFVSPAAQIFSTTAYFAFETNGIAEMVEKNTTRVGVYHGTEIPNLGDAFDVDLVAKNDGPSMVSPMSSPNTLANVASGELAIRKAVLGPNVTVAGGQNSAGQAVAVAMWHMEEGWVDAAIIGAVEVGSFYHDALWRSEADQRNVPLSAELGITVVAETAKSAADRGAEVHGWICGASPGRKANKPEARERLLVATLDDALKDARADAKDLDALILGAGIAVLDGARFIEAWKARFEGVEVPALLLPEVRYGHGEDAGALLSVVGALGVFAGKTIKANGEAPATALAEAGLKTSTDGAVKTAGVLTLDRQGTCTSLVVAAKE